MNIGLNQATSYLNLAHYLIDVGAIPADSMAGFKKEYLVKRREFLEKLLAENEDYEGYSLEDVW